MSKGHEIKVLLLDQDERFAEALGRAGRDQGLRVDWRTSLLELGSVGKLREYDALVVEPLTGPVNGLEIAEYADTFVPGLPVLLVSNEEMPFSLVRWPRSIVGLVPKEAPADEILAELRTHLRQPRSTTWHASLVSA